MWVLKLIAFQLVAGIILTSICLFVWKAMNPGKKPW